MLGQGDQTILVGWDTDGVSFARHWNVSEYRIPNAGFPAVLGLRYVYVSGVNAVDAVG